MTTEHITEHLQPGEHFAVIQQAECLELLETATVAQIAFVNHDGLQLIPLNFAVIDGHIFFRTSPDSILNDLAAGNDHVAFGVDYHAPLYRDGWNVTVKGSTSRVTDPAVHDQVMSWSRLHPWAPGERDVVVRLVPHSMEGRRVAIHR
ncbi:MAG: uncharacterized protein QOJ72_108 [Nocardioidaceae bacterium]|jgi:nitroimidazol reductase NimA-like FMN-containing flavoprotein (pyridoxamine 5'-phosphate oxidase superfamily)|nr:uncharacterized protein [Nocardioidaceae bacterium]